MAFVLSVLNFLGGNPMTTKGVKRKLTAILSADVKGYSRLMGEDEEATVRTLTAYRQIMASLIEQYRGRVVDSPGDNLLAEFASVVDAVQCAVEIQQVLKARNAELPENRRMEFRIGINLGDVIEEEERIYGDGVNIAARVEGFAEAGGICISGSAYEQIKNKLALGYEYLGEHRVKNIAEPVRVYRTQIELGAKRTEKRAPLRRWQRAAIALFVVILLLVAGAVAIWNFYFRLPPVDIAPDVKAALPLPKGPSIAVLPFVNMSGDPEQEYFSDGLSENIITGLSSCPKLFVIARNSTFAYKAKPVKIQRVADELGVQYVLEGSVQKAGERMRITVQLIDASTEHHLWAEKYDRALKDIFALQDEITMRVITALEVKLTEGEQARLRSKGPGNLEAYLKGLKALAYVRRQNKEANILARQEAEEAIALAPKHPALYVLLAATHIADLWYGSSRSPLISFAQATKSLNKAISIDKGNSDAYMVLGNLYLMKREHDKAIAAGQRAIALNPNGADAYAQLGCTLFFSGRSAEAIELLKKAIALNPVPPSYYLCHLGSAYRALGRYEEAIEAYKKGLHREPNNIFAHMGLAATYSLMGHEEEAGAEAAEVLRIDPNLSLKDMEKIDPSKNRARAKRWYDALRKAGLK